MKIQLERDGEFIEAKTRIYVKIGEQEFRISENKFGELVISKGLDGNLIIIPSYANEIRIK